ncbi:Acg family FMN-binding oxidoreductase [Haloechinothrix salitolerans]|uniref:Acg family FMN-binding oxidoreductase n=1 Tax=Haloechinothrix salitolerans TaxID=926830 RepID=A0ABW2C0N2_9PSEU
MTTAQQAIDMALEAAVRAPSPFNAQPWLFEVDGATISLWLDRDRVLTVADPEAREARLACGAALCNLRVALRARNRVGLTRLLPDPAERDLLATVRVAGERKASDVDQQLADAITKRHTNRHPFLERSVLPDARAKLAAAARTEGAELVFVDASERYDTLVRLIRDAERAMENDGAYQHEIKRWLGGPAGRRDGIPTDAVGPTPLSGQLLELRKYYRPNPLPPRLFEQQPLLVAVTTVGSGPRFDVVAGAGMQRTLLAGCTLGLSASFLSQPFEVAETRRELVAEFRDAGEVHTLLRIGYGYPVGPTPRRPVADVMAPPE